MTPPAQKTTGACGRGIRQPLAGPSLGTDHGHGIAALPDRLDITEGRLGAPDERIVGGPGVVGGKHVRQLHERAPRATCDFP
jgi:hypothetical protein